MNSRSKNAREVAAGAVDDVVRKGAFSKHALDVALRQHPLSPADRGLCTELFYGALRYYRPLETSLLRARSKKSARIDRRVWPHLVIAAYQLHHLSERIPARAAINEAVEAVKRARRPMAGFANAILRNLGSPPHDMLPPHASLDEIAAAYGVPSALARAVVRQGADGRAAVAGLCARPRLGVVPLGGLSEQARSHLEDVGEAHALVPGVFMVERLDETLRAALGEPDALMVQDPGSYLVATLCAAKGKKRVLDLCAAPGTKSRALLTHLDRDAKLIAVELDARRAETLAAALVHDGRARVVVADGAALSAELAGPFDLVLVDAPCTGFGTTRRRPEVKLRRDGADPALVQTQAALFDAAAVRVGPGGVLVYAVCSPLPEEGAMQLERFLDAHPDFAVEHPREVGLTALGEAVGDSGAVSLLPHRDDADAFFAVRLVRGP